MSGVVRVPVQLSLEDKRALEWIARVLRKVDSKGRLEPVRIDTASMRIDILERIAAEIDAAIAKLGPAIG